MMKKIILLAGIALLAGSAQAQMRSSGSSAGGSLSFPHPSHGSTASASAPLVNVSATNPGEFVPSTFESYNEAVITGQEQLNARPITVAQAARILQAQKKTETQKPALIVEQDDNGRMVISSGKQQGRGESN
jgi:hypothetical protein